MDNSIILITQARIGSTRFPSKILQLVDDNLSMIELHLYRLNKAKRVNDIIVATTFETGIEDLLFTLKELNIKYHQGALEDVLDRFYTAANDFNADYIVRVTSDCPLIDGDLVDEVIDFTIKNSLDYCSNVLIENFPDGQDVEVFKASALKYAWENAFIKSDREHVTPYIKKNSSFHGGSLFNSMNYGSNINFGNIRMTVDEPADLESIKILINSLGIDASWNEYANFIKNNLSLFSNQLIVRNEGYFKSLKNDEK